ncbi:hypothetical protein MiSe_87940 [Microseira wollei NIES-4236]|uniref:Uncharacterized protein n=1 Tax=Microseira wollei NIES-4236 TaxID=2530354 RepID=A0AAV3XNR4_9CYAN|nr:hypothetical protein MiSe_87940 [Microseira wollei NIES-4236]
MLTTIWAVRPENRISWTKQSLPCEKRSNSTPTKPMLTTTWALRWHSKGNCTKRELALCPWHIAAFQKALQINPNFVEAQNNLREVQQMRSQQRN